MGSAHSKLLRACMAISLVWAGAAWVDPQTAVAAKMEPVAIRCNSPMGVKGEDLRVWGVLYSAEPLDPNHHSNVGNLGDLSRDDRVLDEAMGASAVRGELSVRLSSGERLRIQVHGIYVERDLTDDAVRFATLMTNDQRVREIFVGLGHSGTKSHIEYRRGQSLLTQKLTCASRTQLIRH